MENKVPFFNKGMILNKKILESLRDRPINYLKLLYRGYSNGVISGLELTISETDDTDRIYISEGIIKFDEKYYIIKESWIDIPKDDGLHIFSIVFYDYTKNGSFHTLNYEIIHKVEMLSDMKEGDRDDSELAPPLNRNNIPYKIGEKVGEFEIFRIKRRQGAKVRKSETFEGINDEYNVINMIRFPFSSKNNNILAMELLDLFSEIILTKKDGEYSDKLIAYAIKNRTITGETLKIYIENEKEHPLKTGDNIDVYLALEKILKFIEKKVKGDKKIKTKKTRMLVD